MPRTAITRTTGLSKQPTDGTTVTLAAADTVNKNQTPLTGDELILAQNTGAGANTVTITSVAASNNRTQHITADSLAAGAIHVYGPFALDGWIQSDGQLYFEASSTEVKFAVIQLP